MPTPKQERAARNIIEKPCYKEAFIKAGYAPNTAHNPQKVTESKGFKEAAKPLVEKLQKEIDAIMDEFPKKRGKAGYGEMGTVLKTLIDKKELLSGKPTQILKFDKLDQLSNEELEKLALKKTNDEQSTRGGTTNPSEEKVS